MGPNDFAAAFDEHARPLWCIAAGVIGRSDQVDDVLQDAVMIALAKLEQFDPSTSFLAWMGQIVRFTALNYGRREQRHRNASIERDGVILKDSRPDQPAHSPTISSRGRLLDEQSAFDDKVQDALNTLDQNARACLLLRVILEMPYREIAIALNIPEGTAMSHVHRARHAMRVCMNDEMGSTGEKTLRQGRRHD